MSDFLTCLTLRQPWAECILTFGKDVENRTWPTNYRGPLVIHAGKQWSQEGGDFVHEAFGEVNLLNCLLAPQGALVGIVNLVDVRLFTPDDTNVMRDWAEVGCWHWLLADPRPLSVPIPWQGRQGLWRLTRDDLELALETMTCGPARDEAEMAAARMLLGIMDAPNLCRQ